MTRKRRQMPNLLRFGLFFRAFSSFAHPPYSLPLPLLSNLSPLLPFSKAVNKKLSYRGQTALSVRDKNTNAITTANIMLYLSVRQSRLAGYIMFSTCPFVRPFVRLFVRSSVTNLWTLYFENEWTDFDANWHKSPLGKGMNLESQEVKSQDHRRPKLCLEAWRRHHSLELSRWRHSVSDRNVAFKKLRMVLTAPPRLSICFLLTHLFYLFLFFTNHYLY